jgi:TPR repeat protein
MVRTCRGFIAISTKLKQSMKFIPHLALALAVCLSACNSKRKGLSFGSGSSVPPELIPVLARAEKGDVDAQFEFFQKYRHLATTKEAQAEAAKWCIKAAEQGHVGALGFAYDLYDYGQGVPKDSAKAFEWLLKAAEAKSSGMLSRWVAERYEQGRGTKQQPQMAINWYEKALDQNDVVSAYRLGKIYWNGKGVPSNIEEAIGYFHEAFFLGSDGARYYLAQAYAEGKGVTKDPVQAYAWIKNVSSDAEGATLRNLLENVLTDEQEKEAEKMTHELRNKANQVRQERMKKRAA